MQISLKLLYSPRPMW